MSLTLAQFETAVRLRTRHPDTSDPRASSAQIKALGNAAYQRIRLRLKDIAPQLYLRRTDAIVVDQENDLDFTPVGGTFDSLFLVESLDSLGRWNPVERADEGDPRQHQLYATTFRLEGGLLRFQNMDGPLEESLTVRLTYYVVPTELSTADSLFLVPASMERPLVLFASSELLDQDGDAAEAKACEERAEKLILEASPGLRKQYGTHVNRSGLNRSVNWDCR